MSKRGAGKQITKDNRSDENSDSDDGRISTTASAEVMAKRKILKPRGRNTLGEPKLPFSFNQPKTAASPSPNAFLSFQNSSSSTDDVHEKTKALNVKFIEKLNSLNKEGTIANFVPIAEKYIQFYNDIVKGSKPASSFDAKPLTPSGFSFNPNPSNPTFAASTSNVFSTQSNENKAPAVTKPAFSFAPSNDSKPQAPSSTTFNFAPKAEEKKEVPVPEKAPESAPAKVVPSKDESDESDSDDSIKVEGPKFTLTSKPTIKNAPFSFGPKPVKKPIDSDSESEVEIKGPSFTFNKTIKDSVFKLEPKKDSAAPVAAAATAAAVAPAPAPAPAPAEKPAFSFGASSTTSKPAFSFGSTNNTVEQKQEQKAEKPAFSFGSSDNTKQDKTAFSFGSSAAGQSQEKPTFSFGSSDKTSSEPKQDKPAFSFGSSDVSQQKQDKPAFSFGAASKPATTETLDKPAFSFGSSESNGKSSAPTFGSDSSKSTPNPFSFTPNSEDDKAPAPFSGFNFSNNNGDNKTTKFSFNKPPTENGSTSGDATKDEGQTPSIFGSSATFGAGSGSSIFLKSADSNEASADQPKPAFSFKFGSNSNNSASHTPNSAGAFSFGKPSGGEASTEETKVDEETGGDFKPVGSLSNSAVSASTGEEDEEVLYEKKAKLMLLDSSNKENPYVTKGLGELKILKSKETAKSRIVIRADGGLRVLLNTLISKDLKYETMGNGSLVRVPTINPQTKSFDTYIIRVKTADDGQELLNTINGAKA